MMNYSGRLNDTEVRVGSSDDMKNSSICGKIYNGMQNVATVNCRPPINGNFVRIARSEMSNNCDAYRCRNINFCEVELWGTQ